MTETNGPYIVIPRVIEIPRINSLPDGTLSGLDNYDQALDMARERGTVVYYCVSNHTYYVPLCTCLDPVHPGRDGPCAIHRGGG